MPLRTQIVRPALQDRYFSKVIGRGYPPPTFKFRWCTDVLRIKPIRSVINNTNEQSVILLGTRKGESIERDRVLSRYKTSREYYFQQANSRNVVIYSPLIEYQASDIWSILRNNSMPQSIDTEKLQILYSIVNSGHANDLSATDILNAKGRFGCWTCTVIRHDRAVENLIRGGEKSLVPLFEFRNWLVLIRDNPSYRLKTRRNGNRGPGPFTIEAREEILDRLLEAQSRARFNLISIEETEFIRNQWLLDS